MKAKKNGCQKVNLQKVWVQKIHFIAKLISTWNKIVTFSLIQECILMRGYLVNACDITDARKLYHWFEWATHTHMQSCSIRIFQSVLLSILMLLLLLFHFFFFAFVLKTSWNWTMFLWLCWDCLHVSLSPPRRLFVCVASVRVSCCCLSLSNFSLFL